MSDSCLLNATSIVYPKYLHIFVLENAYPLNGSVGTSERCKLENTDVETTDGDSHSKTVEGIKDFKFAILTNSNSVCVYDQSSHYLATNERAESRILISSSPRKAEKLKRSRREELNLLHFLRLPYTFFPKINFRLRMLLCVSLIARKDSCCLTVF